MNIMDAYPFDNDRTDAEILLDQALISNLDWPSRKIQELHATYSDLSRDHQQARAIRNDAFDTWTRHKTREALEVFNQAQRLEHRAWIAKDTAWLELMRVQHGSRFIGL